MKPERVPELKRQLEHAERRIAEGAGQIKKQKALIEDLKHSLAISRSVLKTMQETQRFHKDHRARIIRQLREWVPL